MFDVEVESRNSDKAKSGGGLSAGHYVGIVILIAVVILIFPARAFYLKKVIHIVLLPFHQ